MKRMQQSGAQKRRLAQEKKQKHDESLKNIPKISDMFSTKVIEQNPNSAQTINTEDLCEKNVSGEAAGPSGQSVGTENMRGENEFGEFSDATIDFDDDHDHFSELFLNVSSSSRHSDIETQFESAQSSKAAHRFPTDVALWNLVADISLLQRYWTKLGKFIFRFTVSESFFL